MKIFNNLTIIGTSHVAKESVELVKKTILENQPKFVALELDKARFMALMQKPKKATFKQTIKSLGIKGYFFNLIGSWVEKKVGKMVGSAPGSEMKIATFAAIKVEAKVALIDRDIRITIKNFFKYLTWKEKFRFFGDIFKGLILRKNEFGKFDLSKVPPEKLIRKVLKMTKKRYPSFYKALVKERNIYMAKSLYKLMKEEKDGKIIAVVGAGHEEGMIKELKRLKKKNGI